MNSCQHPRSKCDRSYKQNSFYDYTIVLLICSVTCCFLCSALHVPWFLPVCCKMLDKHRAYVFPSPQNSKRRQCCLCTVSSSFRIHWWLQVVWSEGDNKNTLMKLYAPMFAWSLSGEQEGGNDNNLREYRYCPRESRELGFDWWWRLDLVMLEFLWKPNKQRGAVEERWIKVKIAKA